MAKNSAFTHSAVQLIEFKIIPGMLDTNIYLNLFRMQMEEYLVQYKGHCVLVNVQRRITLCSTKNPRHLRIILQTQRCKLNTAYIAQ